MDKREIWAQKHTRCCICQPMDTQAQNINQHLLETMQNRLEKDVGKKFSELDQNQHIVEFPQLMKMIYKRKYKSHQITKNCSHQNLKKKFMDELRCNERQFNSLANSFSWKLAKYNFHVDTISQQCKTFTRHIIQKDGSNKKKQIDKINVRQVPKEKSQQRQYLEYSLRQGKKSNQDMDLQKSQQFKMKSQKQNTSKSSRQIREQKVLTEIQALQEQNKKFAQILRNQKQVPQKMTTIGNNQKAIKAREPQLFQFMQKQYPYPYYPNHYPRPPPMPFHDPMFYYHQQNYRRIYDPASYFMPTMMDFSQFSSKQDKQKQKGKTLNSKSYLKVEPEVNQNKIGQGLDTKDNGLKSPISKSNQSSKNSH